MMVGQMIVRIDFPRPTEEVHAKRIGETINSIIRRETGKEAEIEYYEW